MAGRFPLYTDADVHGPLVDALIRGGWDVLRAVDAFPERTDDDVHFERAIQLDRVMVSNDRDVRTLAVESLRGGKRFRGLIAWPQEHYRMEVTCSRCGAEVLAPQGPSAWRDLLSGPIALIRLEEYLKVSCPKCGHGQDAENRRFFGTLKASAIRWLVAALVFGMLLTVLLFRF